MAKKNQKNNREEAEIDDAYYGITGKKPKASNRGKTGLIVGIAAGIMVLCIGAVVFALSGRLFGSKPIHGVTVASLNLEGYTEDQARAALGELAQKYESTPMQVTVLDETVSITPQQSGISLDTEALMKKVLSGTPGSVDVLPYLSLDEPGIWQAIGPILDKYGASPTKTAWEVVGDAPTEEDPQGSRKLLVTMGTPDYGMDGNLLYAKIENAYRMTVFSVSMEPQSGVVEPEKPNLEEIWSSFCTEAKNAELDKLTFEIIPEQPGYGFDLESAKQALENAGYGQVLEFPFAATQPEVTGEALTATLYCDILGEYKTPHTKEPNRNENLRLACEAINGLVLLPGEQFSYNDVLGKRTAEKGYRPAPSYVNGLTVDTVGGGICQVSSTLYYCTLLSDMEIVLRSPHGYVSSYIPKGLDAAVSWPSQDFRFANSSAYPIRIEAWMAEGFVHVKILGTEERDYYVELVSEELESYPYETEYREYPADNKEGYADGDVVITPYTGCKAKTYKKLYDRETGKLIDTILITTTSYNSRNKVICVIKDDEPLK